MHAEGDQRSAYRMNKPHHPDNFALDCWSDSGSLAPTQSLTLQGKYGRIIRKGYDETTTM